MNSLHSKGHVTPAFRMSWRYSKLPWKYLRSVSTLKQAAPPCSYALAICHNTSQGFKEHSSMRSRRPTCRNVGISSHIGVCSKNDVAVTAKHAGRGSTCRIGKQASTEAKVHAAADAERHILDFCIAATNVFANATCELT